MTAPNYPNNPTVGQEFTVGLVTYKWDGEKWNSVGGNMPVSASQVQMHGGGTLDQLGVLDSQILIAAVKALDIGRKYGEFVLVEDFAHLVVAGNWTSAWNAALATGKNVAGSTGVNYSVSGKLFAQNNQYIDLRGSTITQLTDQTPIFDAVNRTGVTVTGGKLVGKAEAVYLNSPSSLAIGVLATGATNLKVYDMEFSGFYYSPLMVASGGNGVWFYKNKVTGIPAILSADVNRRNTTGVTVLGDGIWIVENEISGTASGIIIGQQSSNIFVDHNYVHGMVNEHGMYLDTAINNAKVSHNTVVSTGSVGAGIKVQIYNELSGDCRDIHVSDNTIINTGAQGVLVVNTSVVPSKEVVGLKVVNNTVINAGSDAFSIRSAGDGIVADNLAINPNGSGISYGACRNINIAENILRGAGRSGIRDLSVSQDVTVFKNKIRNPCRLVIGGDNYGIYLSTLSQSVRVDSNDIRDSASNMRYGFFSEADLNAELTLVNNDVQGAFEFGCRFIATTPLREYRDNRWNGVLGGAFNSTQLPSVDSATTITLPAAYDVVRVTGTTNINTITATGNTNRRITLIFAGALTVGVAGNIRMAAAFNAVADRQLTLVSDGTLWHG